MRIPHDTSYFFRMSKLIYITNTSLDGYVEDETGAFDWVIADQVHAFITELVRPVGTYLYGRRLYETMAYWDAAVIEGYPRETPRLRTDLAEGREDRLFTNADRCYDTQDACRAGLRRRGYSEPQAGIGARHHHWRRRACGACARSRSRRRMSPVCQPDDRRRRKAGIPSRLATESRTL